MRMTKELNWIDIQYYHLVSTLKEVTFTISSRLQTNPNLNKRKNTTTKINGISNEQVSVSAFTAERLDLSRNFVLTQFLSFLP